MLIPANFLQLWSKASSSHGRTNYVERLVNEAGKASYFQSKKRVHLALSGSQEQSFGTRKEYRVQLGVFGQLNLDSQPCRQAELRPYYSTVEALLFLR